MAGTVVYLSTVGAPVPASEARISVFDRGFLYGDSVYETMRTAGGRALELARHLARLRRSGDGIALPVPWSDEALATAIDQTHRASGNPESYVRVIVTRGEGRLMLDPRQANQPNLVIIVQPLEVPSDAAYRRGISVVIVDRSKTQISGLDPSIKSGNYLGSILALQQAVAAGGDDAILCNPEGDVAEGASSNVFFVHGGQLLTPDLSAGILPGITRETVCELAAAIGHPVRFAKVMPEQLRRADEVFLTSSVRGIMPVNEVDGVQIGDGTIGPVTQTLRDTYERYLAGAAAGQ